MSWSQSLSPYILHPDQHEKDLVVYYDDIVTIIHDGFGKSTYHLLILPRDSKLTKKHPTTGVTAHIKNLLQTYVDWCTNYIYDHFTGRYEILPSNDNLSMSSKEDFIEQFILVGVHSVPSMNNLHIHVLTRDFHSLKLKNKKHYNSFNTKFFVQWDQLPLHFKPDKHEMENVIIKKSDLICCYCNKNFSNKFSQLKKHLGEEFDSHFKLNSSDANVSDNT
ncbi:aprataxin-like protein [Monosporozyma unispora]|nr:aprataxin-like protein [Kazachstania unispora]